MSDPESVGAPASATLWRVWQLVDSAFPTGGFGHSGGLEAAWQQGEISGRAGLEPFLEASLRQAGQAAIPWVTAAWGDAGRLAELDALCEAWTLNHVANRASRAQGRAYWTAVTHAFLPDLPPAPEPGHLAPLFGHLMRRLGLERMATVELFLFLQARSLVSAAVRLGVLGPLEAQGCQGRLAPVLSEVARTSATLGLEDLAQTSPLIDLWQGAQDRLYSRLFQS